jgi:hypothetical protein
VCFFQNLIIRAGARQEPHSGSYSIHTDAGNGSETLKILFDKKTVIKKNTLRPTLPTIWLLLLFRFLKANYVEIPVFALKCLNNFCHGLAILYFSSVQRILIHFYFDLIHVLVTFKLYSFYTECRLNCICALFFSSYFCDPACQFLFV